uniref:Uncharacterized protein n=1 Tax=Chromera velia CCMP2878 TaxID=1169474 RepID=A0A0G4FAV2_9ALVE|eukprot:Cvel_16069.t1-p1 / transcript=Cvel_16069.t1 / gene=Cvel_16069 / organism=Chromera_velia_CCMP2878 / gene_product=hypothetical protein / transcript_product=hypothetical protein / location=Cvel_scaffold1221:37929-38462(+) / protein_length=178 / sequence_SO=supercontig / SO=protein_coding / is_pseudo=false
MPGGQGEAVQVGGPRGGPTQGSSGREEEPESERGRVNGCVDGGARPDLQIERGDGEGVGVLREANVTPEAMVTMASWPCLQLFSPSIFVNVPDGPITKSFLVEALRRATTGMKGGFYFWVEGERIEARIKGLMEQIDGLGMELEGRGGGGAGIVGGSRRVAERRRPGEGTRPHSKNVS